MTDTVYSPCETASPFQSGVGVTAQPCRSTSRVALFSTR